MGSKKEDITSRGVLTANDVRELLNSGCDNQSCTNPHCKEEQWLTAACHPHSDVAVRVNQFGVLTVFCGICERPIADFRISETPEPPFRPTDA